MNKPKIILKSEKEIGYMQMAGEIVVKTLNKLREAIVPGITTYELDQIAENLILQAGGKPSFKGYRGFPNAICVSINEQVVHGVPSRRHLKAGDIISIDVGVILNDYHADAAITLPVGKVSNGAQQLMKVTESSLYKGIEQAQAGNFLSDISAAIQKHVESNGFSVIRDLAGHGIGKKLHEPPEVPNFGKPGQGVKLKAGMTLAIEPMVNRGSAKIKLGQDGWTVSSEDGSLSAHFEHTIVITTSGPKILTPY